MKALIALTLTALSFALLGAVANSQELPPIPEGGLRTVYETVCSDQETGEDGYCFLREDVQHPHKVTSIVQFYLSLQLCGQLIFCVYTVCIL